MIHLTTDLETAVLSATEVTTDHLIIQIEFSPEAGMEFPTEYVIDDIVTLNQQVLMTVRPGNVIADPILFVMPLDAKVTVTL